MAELLRFHFPSPDSRLPSDAAARAEALDIRKSFIVEAPAGSGKTGLLIQRYLKLLTDEAVTAPEQVLAITFTNKATAELHERVIAQLELAQLNPAPPALDEFASKTRELACAVLARDQQLGWSLLEHPHRLHLRTIDSVCAEIARTLPILSRSGGRLKPAADSGPLHREAARRTILLLGSGNVEFDGALRNLLLHRDGNLADCESLLARMLSLRDQWAHLIPLNQQELEDAWLDANVLPRLEQTLDYAICRSLTRLERMFPPHLLAELTELAADFGRYDAHDAGPSPVALCAGLRQSPEAVSADLERWRGMIHLLVTAEDGWRKEKGITGKNLRFLYDRQHPHHSRLVTVIQQLSGREDLLAGLCDVRLLPPAQYPAEQWVVAKSLFRVLSRALVELQLVFAERGECDFTELSLLARHALEQDSGTEDLAAALGARLQHLLVDEMQDTSTSQYDLIERLTATWDGHSQTVFLVGDPHQSIYLFRQARVERFTQAMLTQQLGDVPLNLLHLTANFRSQHTLVEQFNRDFELIFPHSDPSAPYHPVQATLPLSPFSRATVWHAHPLNGASTNGSGLTKAETRQRQARKNAEEIVQIARRWLEKPLPPDRVKPWSIAVLVRSRNHLGEIVTALRRQKDPIPFRAVDIESLSERQEILDLTALTRALLHPADRVAGLSILRAPWCGLPLADLYTLTAGDDPAFRRHSIPRLMAERGHLLPDESCRRMTRVWLALEAAATQRGSLSAAQLVERTWLSLGGDAWLTSNQLTNSRRFFQLLEELEASDSRIDAGVLEARLQRLYAEPESIPEDAGSIELLTIHNAKGLEWDVVLVPALEKQVEGNRSHLLSWSAIDMPPSPADSVHVMLAPIAGKGEPSQALNRWLNCIHRTRELEEIKRLFYVASTRAREELHLFASPDLNARGAVTLCSHSLLKAAWPAAEAHFASASAASSAMWARALGSEAAAPGPVELEQLDLAAAAAPVGPALVRVPSTFDPALRFLNAANQLPIAKSQDATIAIRAPFTRPEGSLAARSYGNAVHACLDLLSTRILNGDPPMALLTELPAWRNRIAALLRSDGLAPQLVERLTRETRATLDKVLRDPAGLWLLTAHARAASEFSITSSATSAPSPAGNALPATIRVDRIFDAGSEPHAPGNDTLWIIDYKTSGSGTAPLDGFLASQRATYGPQLEVYARVLGLARATPVPRIRLALYFPAIPYLLWWKPAAV